MDVDLIWTIADWVQAIARLQADGPLPCRTVLVPHERVAHALRRELVRTGRTDLLGGTRFVGPENLAGEVLRATGSTSVPGKRRFAPCAWP